MQRIAHDHQRSVREQNPEVPPWLDKLIHRLLDKDPSRRFASADALATILRGELAHMLNPTEVKEPLRPWEQTQRPSRKSPSRWGVQPGSIVGILAIAAFVAMQFGAPRDNPRKPSGEFSSAGQLSRDVHPANTPPLKSFADETAPLWNVDGTDEVHRRAGALEDELRSDFRSRDSWQQDVDAIRGRMANLFREPF